MVKRIAVLCNTVAENSIVRGYHLNPEWFRENYFS